MNDKALIDDCFLHDKDRLRHDEALAIMRANLACTVATETIPCDDALGRILAQDVTAPHPVPLHRNAAVDGYAFAHKDIGQSPLPVSARIAAGATNIAPLADGCAARIFTGAPMPEGADTVAMQEDCSEDAGNVQLPQGLKHGANCRQAGEDLAKGDSAVSANTRLRPAHLAALASVGAFEIPARKKLRVTLLSSGNELREPGKTSRPLEYGEVWDTNAPMLKGLVQNLPVEIVEQTTLSDDKETVQTALTKAAEQSDLIITTGGASRGQEDHMLGALDTLGKRHMWQLAIKPGRPMMFGQIPKTQSSDCFFLGLPGNPVAAMVCFLLYGREMILRLAGEDPKPVAAFMVPAAFSIDNKKLDRREFLRGVLETDSSGAVSVNKFGRDGSGLISSLTQADGLIEIEEETGSVKQGDLVRFLPFSSFN